MCGIAGIIGSTLSTPELDAAANWMRMMLGKRGPDDSGVFLSPRGGVCLAHTRLAILDLTSAGHQPMHSSDGRYTIVFNGEIYNFRELRRELAANGEVFASDSDTEVILGMYRHYGPACVHDLHGMFAFAIWDEEEQKAFLARDPFGIKPLYLCEQDGTLIFASEVRALLASGIVPRQPCREAILGYCLFGTVQEPLTIVEGVRALSPGHHMTWKAGKGDYRRYWDPQIIGEGISEDSAATVVRQALEESIQRHLVSDVPVGVFLSGGVDSTAVVALAKQSGAGKIPTLSIRFNDPEFDEGDLALRTSEHFDTDHHQWKLNATSGRGLLHEFLDATDQPSIDGFNTFCIARFAHRTGLKVVLSGLGGDELFGGYGSFQYVPRLVRAGRWIGVIPFASVLAGEALWRIGRSPRLRRLSRYLVDRPSPAMAYWCMRGIFTPSEAGELTRHFLGPGEASSSGAASRHFVVPRQPTLEDTVSYLELTRYMRNQLLRDSDVMSMASSLELRLPFVDRKLFEVLRHIPSSRRLAKGKALLVQAVPEIPEWVTSHSKRGFVFPFEQWMREEWGDLFDRRKQAYPVKLRTWYQRWCVYALEHSLTHHGLC